ncbi:MAG: HPr kinase/phosphatase C-terminal domain-containing protein [Paracoccaceae bacterium]
MTTAIEETLHLHATTVAWSGRGVLLMGPSGSGKSGLALQLMAWGCDLVSDDGTVLSRRDGAVYASAPAAIRGRIEARGIGLLAAATVPAARLHLAVDLGTVETHRLPPERVTEFLGCALPLLHSVESAHFPAAILQYLKAGRAA